MLYNLCQANNKDIRMTTYIVLKFTVNRFHIMLCFYYAFWTGKFQIELIVKKISFKISGPNIWHEPIESK